MFRRRRLAWVVVAITLACGQATSGQMIHTQMPLQANSSSFYEHSHVGWSVYNPHYFLQVNGGGGTPPFGGYHPDAGLHGGFAAGNAHFDFGFGQGASITSTTASPSLTTTNGFPGLLFIGTERPFVTGVIPQVGGAGFASVATDPLTARLAAGEFRMEQRRVVVPAVDVAGQRRVDVRPAHPGPEVAATLPIPGVATSRQDLPATDYLNRGSAAEREGRPGVARIYYQLAAAKGDANIRAQASAKLDALKAPVTPQP